MTDLIRATPTEMDVMNEHDGVWLNVVEASVVKALKLENVVGALLEIEARLVGLTGFSRGQIHQALVVLIGQGVIEDQAGFHPWGLGGRP